MTKKCLPKRQDLKKNQQKISFFTTSEKENPWSEHETDTGTTTETNEPIEVNDDVSHEASENKEQGKFPPRWSSLYTWLTYNKYYMLSSISFAEITLRPIIIKSNGPLGRGIRAPRPENDFLQFKQFWAILEAINSCHSIVCSNANAFTAVHFVFIFFVC